MFDKKAEQMHDSFCIVLENSKDEARIYQDQLNTLAQKIDKMDTKFENRFDDLEDEVKFIKNYLVENLDPRVEVLERSR